LQNQLKMATKCTANTASGDPCKNNARQDGLCGIHYNSSQRIAEEERRVAEMLAAETAQRVAEQTRAREEHTRQNVRRMEHAPACCMDDMIRYTRLLGDIWVDYRVPGNTIALAYCAMRKTSIQHSGWPPLIRAVVNIVNIAYFDFTNRTWTNLDEEERAGALRSLEEALIPEFRHDILNVLKVADKVYLEYRRRLTEERLAAQAARIAAAQAARDAAFAERMRAEPIVFSRDPEGGIDIAAFATDRENVHRSSVQKTTENAIQILLKRPLLPEQETLREIIAAFSEPKNVRFRAGSQELAITEITNDYYLVMAFNAPYGDVLDRVWAYITTHTEKRELIRRLAQEVCEGVRQCGNGKMARLINVLQGYDEEIMAASAPSREGFQHKFAKLNELPLEQRAAAAAEVFNEYMIPEGERAEWLDPLLNP